MCFADDLLGSWTLYRARHPARIAMTICKEDRKSESAHWLGVAAPRGGCQACSQTIRRRDILPPLMVVSHCLSLGWVPTDWVWWCCSWYHLLAVSNLVPPRPGSSACLLRSEHLLCDIATPLITLLFKGCKLSNFGS